MEIDMDVRGSIAGVLSPEDDTLKVVGVDGVVTKRQCCYEQKTITMYSSQANGLDYIQQLAYRTLHDDMDMDPEAAEKAKYEVATTIRDKILPARNRYPPLSTILLEIHVDCTLEVSDKEAGEPSGEHGFSRLLEYLGNDDCAICLEEFDSTNHIVVTTCHHTYHHVLMSIHDSHK
ncbi:hypothetical protein EJ110_NYTH45302 [Nymphaea thermarum]|nr:hypothetical protein EJ110_NYTH45302 [Nymphaea thermarum]